MTYYPKIKMDSWADILVEVLKILGVSAIIYIFLIALETLINISDTLTLILEILNRV